MTIIVLWSLFLISVEYAFGANILLIYDVPSPSHQMWDYSIAEGLMAKGHNITMMGPFEDKGKMGDNYHPLATEGILEVLANDEDFDLEQALPNYNSIQYLKLLMDYGLTVCNHSYHTNGYKTLFNYPKDFKFDLMIIDVTLAPCAYPFIQRFGYPPTIGITAFLLPPFSSYILGNDIQPSYLPIYVSEFTDKMTFFQRLLNYIYTRMDLFIKGYVERWQTENMARRFFGEDMDSIESLERHISLLLCNLNPAIGYLQPLTPNIIPVGGLHVKKPKKLSTELQTTIDNAKNGVILFSLGSNIRSSNLKAEMKLKLLDAFAQLKQTVLWKFETQLENLPKNVVISKWLPQNDILGHPNTRLFITHGGALSTYEAMYHGVPVIGMPFFLDQKVNVNFFVDNKLGLRIEVNNFTSNELLRSINEILTNPIYSNNMKDYSRRMRDQPQPPLERAVFWAEYAMRHNGAECLNPKSRDMSLLVSSSSDVILFLVSVIVILISILIVVCKKICSFFRRKSTKKQKLN